MKLRGITSKILEDGALGVLRSSEKLIAKVAHKPGPYEKGLSTYVEPFKLPGLRLSPLRGVEVDEAHKSLVARQVAKFYEENPALKGSIRKVQFVNNSYDPLTSDSLHMAQSRAADLSTDKLLKGYWDESRSLPNGEYLYGQLAFSMPASAGKNNAKLVINMDQWAASDAADVPGFGTFTRGGTERHRFSTMVRHELGHQIHYAAARGSAIPFVLQTNPHLSPEKIGKMLKSQYAATSGGEAFAEAYAAMGNGPIPESLAGFVKSVQANVNSGVRGELFAETPGQRGALEAYVESMHIANNAGNPNFAGASRLPNAGMNNGRRHSSARSGLPVRSSATGRFR